MALPLTNGSAAHLYVNPSMCSWSGFPGEIAATISAAADCVRRALGLDLRVEVPLDDDSRQPLLESDRFSQPLERIGTMIERVLNTSHDVDKRLTREELNALRDKYKRALDTSGTEIQEVVVTAAPHWRARIEKIFDRLLAALREIFYAVRNRWDGPVASHPPAGRPCLEGAMTPSATEKKAAEMREREAAAAKRADARAAATAAAAVRARRDDLETAIASQDSDSIVAAVEAGGLPYRYDVKFPVTVGPRAWLPETVETTLIGVMLSAGRVDLADALRQAGVSAPAYASPMHEYTETTVKEASESMEALYWHVRCDPTFPRRRDRGGTIFHHLARITAVDPSERVLATGRLNFAFRAYANLPAGVGDPFHAVSGKLQTPLHIIAQRVVNEVMKGAGNGVGNGAGNTDDTFAAIMLPTFLGHAVRRKISLSMPDMEGNTVAGLLHRVLANQPESILASLQAELRAYPDTLNLLLTHKPSNEHPSLPPLPCIIAEGNLSRARLLIDAACTSLHPNDAAKMLQEAADFVVDLGLKKQLELAKLALIDDTTKEFQNLQTFMRERAKIENVLASTISKLSKSAEDASPERTNQPHAC